MCRISIQQTDVAWKNVCLHTDWVYKNFLSMVSDMTNTYLTIHDLFFFVAIFVYEDGKKNLLFHFVNHTCLNFAKSIETD